MNWKKKATIGLKRKPNKLQFNQLKTMSKTIDSKSNTLTFESLTEDIQPSGWPHLNQLRAEAWEAFQNQGIPGSRNEEYKFSPFQKFLAKDVIVRAGIASREIPSFLDAFEGIKIQWVNGVLDEAHSDLSNLAAHGMELHSLHGYLEERGVLPEAYQSYVPVQSDAFAALNTALYSEAYVLTIPKGKVVETPVFFIHQYHHEGEGTAVSFPKLFLRAGENSEAKIYEIHTNSGGGKSLAVPVFEIHQEINAHLNVCKLDLGDQDLIAVNGTQMKQSAKAHFSHVNISLCKGVVRNNLNLGLQTEHADGNMYGLYLLHGKAHVDNHTSVDHRMPMGESNELYKGILSEKATGVFNGKIFVRPQAQKTNAFQSNGNILLDDTATIHTKPQLEIWADDVKCSHGCTVGQLDEDAMFYLRARGLSEKEAKAMLLNAFASEVIEHISAEDVKDWVQHQIEQRLGA